MTALGVSPGFSAAIVFSAANVFSTAIVMRTSHIEPHAWTAYDY
jgi:hypothetical protein